MIQTKLGTWISKWLLANNKVMLDYNNDPYRKQMFEIANLYETSFKGSEAYHLYTIAKSIAEKYPYHNFAEVGVFSGRSARLICRTLTPNNDLYLFDTFEGLPKPTKEDQDQEGEGKMKGTLEEVQEQIKEFKRQVIITKGYFPNSVRNIKSIKGREFAFVHIDVDLYKSVKETLEFFYPRMIKGGVIITHDYIGLPGGKKAFDEFFKDKPEIVIELTGNQAVVIKV